MQSAWSGQPLRSEMANVITISGRQTGNKVIHLPATSPIEIVTSPSGQVTLTRHNRVTVTNASPTVTSPRHSAKATTDRDNSTNEDNGDVKTLDFDGESNVSREPILIPTDIKIKEELIEYEYEEYEEYESLDEEDMDDNNRGKNQYKCSGCGKGFCFEGWLDRHKQTSPACRDAHPIKTSDEFKEPLSRSQNRERQSLEGRLTETLHCPNDNCDFTTHWVQSLNKHTSHSCKFKRPNSSRNSPVFDSMSSSSSGLSCHICNKSFSDSDQHLRHMAEVHRFRHLYQCSGCNQHFTTQQESDAHIEKYHRSPNQTPEAGLSNGSQQCWTCETCNKSYLSSRSYKIHRTSCEKGLSIPIRSPATPRQSTVSTGPKKTLPISNSVTHFRREQIEAIHTIDFRCKLCRKLFDSSFGLCNHLSRRPVCREWYYTNLPIELKKRNSLHLMPKFAHNSRTNVLTNRSSNGGTASSSPRRKLPIARRPSDDSACSSDQNTAQCNRCNKIFIGKNPTVALTNHLRGSACHANSRKPEVVHSRVSKAANSGTRVRAPQNCGENRYYCKLCPEVEVKNRVSLGCHLTIYHGLPQVGVDTGKGDGFRCQTCSQVFDSKYFYNLHRQDCDLTSPYVGMITDGELASRHFKNSSKGETCNQCGRDGFTTTTAVNIHQKYQCVKRNVSKNQTNLRRFQTNQTSSARSQPTKPQKPTVFEPIKPIPRAEMARLNDRAKSDPSVTMCDSCGRGPYNSYYYFMEHKKKYCTVLKGDAPQEAKAKKSFPVEQSSYKTTENFCLNPTVPRARKTFTYANVSSPQISHDSSSPLDNENESEEVLVTVTEVTKCSVCPEEFEDTLAFIRHRLGHITEELTINEMVEAIECELCGARVHHYQRIQQHLILHLQNEQIMKKKNLIEVKKKNLDFRQHIISQSDDDDEDQDGSVLRCPYCNSEYMSREDLAQHIKNTCPYRYQCPFCSNTYSAKESFLRHKEICSKSSAIDKLASKAPTYKCRNCGLEFKIKQQLLCHEHACNKVYTADHSGRVEELIERTLTCSVCGLVSDVYESKVKHESQCVKRYLSVIGNGTEEIQSTGEATAQPAMDFNLTSLSNTSQSSDVPEEVINNLRQEFGIKKELKVLLTGFDEELVRKVKTNLYTDRDESTQFEALKESFRTLLGRQMKNNSILHDMTQNSSAEVVLQKMLNYLGLEPVQNNGLNQLECFRLNLQQFLNVTIKGDTLELAYKDAESVDEAVVNMLNFECEFDS